MPPQGSGDGSDDAFSAIVKQEPSVALPFAVEVAGPSAGPALAPAPDTLVLSGQDSLASGRRLLQLASVSQSSIWRPKLPQLGSASHVIINATGSGPVCPIMTRAATTIHCLRL